MYRNFVQTSKKLRHDATDAEKLLWSKVKNRQIANIKFRRQYVLGNFIADFCAIEKKLVIELDGGGHAEQEQRKKDLIKDQFFEDKGFKVLRIWNHELFENLDGVLIKIYELVSRDKV